MNKGLLIFLLFLWFYIDPMRSINNFSQDWLYEGYSFWDFNRDGIVNFEDYVLLTNYE